MTVQVRKALLAAILDGRFVDRLPPEDELCAMLNTSRTTVRAAVQELERDGLVTRRRALGTLINRHVGFDALALQRVVGFDWLLTAKGYDVKTEIRWERGRPTRWADLLPDVADADCWIAEKRFYADGELAVALVDVTRWSELSVSHLPEQLPASLFAFSQNYWKRSVSNAVAQIVPMVVRDESTTWLNLEIGTPFVRLVETHFDAAGSPIAWSVIDLLDSILRLAVFRPQ
ncbi:GntR family transcriptional regulator [Rhodococcus ruber]|uniref:GntR family transcriptional regulator n=1 Tax=Rhodococcus ruber TaxID=1830 RepID=UPI00315CF100